MIKSVILCCPRGYLDFLIPCLSSSWMSLMLFLTSATLSPSAAEKDARRVNTFWNEARSTHQGQEQRTKDWRRVPLPGLPCPPPRLPPWRIFWFQMPTTRGRGQIGSCALVRRLVGKVDGLDAGLPVPVPVFQAKPKQKQLSFPFFSWLCFLSALEQLSLSCANCKEPPPQTTTVQCNDSSSAVSSLGFSSTSRVRTWGCRVRVEYESSP